MKPKEQYPTDVNQLAKLIVDNATREKSTSSKKSSGKQRPKKAAVKRPRKWSLAKKHNRNIICSMNQLSLQKRAQIIQLLVEGNSLRSASRIADVSINTVTKLLLDVGEACVKYHSKIVANLNCKRLQCDEIYSFVYSRDRETAPDVPGNGTVYTWVAIDPDTKLVVSWYAGLRDQDSANIFMRDVRARVRNRPQLSTDGFPAYREAVQDTFGGKVDFAQLVKVYNGKPDDSEEERTGRYQGAEKRIISGNPDLKRVTTAHVERQNLTMRMGIRRFGRRTNAFSKKLENHRLAIALHFVYYNFVRRHKTLRITPAMEHGLSKRFMSIEDMVLLTHQFPTDKAPKDLYIWIDNQ
jgi:IS1 family transposase/transposase-like protein